MSPATCTLDPRHYRDSSLTRRERRLVRQLIDTNPVRLRQVWHDRRIGQTADRLLASYRDEMLSKLSACIEVSLRD